MKIIYKLFLLLLLYGESDFLESGRVFGSDLNQITVVKDRVQGGESCPLRRIKVPQTIVADGIEIRLGNFIWSEDVQDCLQNPSHITKRSPISIWMYYKGDLLVEVWMQNSHGIIINVEDDCWHFRTIKGKITLTDSTWENHISKRHTQVTIPAIHDALVTPEKNYKSGKYWCFERNNLRVVVNLNTMKVKTAYFIGE